MDWNVYVRYINSYLHVGILADMLSQFSGASNAVQGVDPGAGGEVSNSSNQVLYDQGTVQKCYMLLKIKWKINWLMCFWNLAFPSGAVIMWH